MHLYQGRKLLLDENAKIVNPNQRYVEKYYSRSWTNFLKTTKSYCRIDVIDIIDGKGEKWRDENFVNKIKSELEESRKQDQRPLTEDQKRIKELEMKLEQLTKSLSESKEVIGANNPIAHTEESNTPVEQEEGELQQLRDLYNEKFGKKPHPRMSVESLKEKLN